MSVGEGSCYDFAVMAKHRMCSPNILAIRHLLYPIYGWCDDGYNNQNNAKLAIIDLEELK